jgi:cob(I)alamin adenosyltransferase
MQKGYVQVYTGNGKGKTTAALGLALRAAGAGLRVYIGQFMKGLHYSELEAAKKLAPFLAIEQYGHPEFCVPGKVSEEDYQLARVGMDKLKAALHSGDFDVVVMDEICTALHFGLIEAEEVLGVMRTKPENVELVLTGRYAPDAILAAADLVTEMREVKHYYQKDVPARKGIEN